MVWWEEGSLWRVQVCPDEGECVVGTRTDLSSLIQIPRLARRLRRVWTMVRRCSQDGTMMSQSSRYGYRECQRWRM